MNEYIVESSQRNSLSSALSSLNDGDSKCLEEIRQVLEKHHRLERFGVYLIHSPFDIDIDEVWVETADLDSREVLIRPVKKSFFDDYKISLQPTVIGFDQNGYHQICGCIPHSSDYPQRHFPQPEHGP
jgi:hypothetical protein